MSTRPSIVLASVLRAVAPLVRLLVRNGVTYGAFASALKRVFLQAAEAELAAQGMPRTASAITLLSGVHRRDVRNLKALPRGAAGVAMDQSMGLVSEVVARWRQAHAKRGGGSSAITRTQFDALVEAISSDVRPRAVLDELVRLGAASDGGDRVSLVAESFVPRQGFEQMAQLFADNLGDHAAAAAANLHGGANFLEQAVFVDQISAVSVQQLRQAAVAAWKQSREIVMAEAQARFDADARQVDPASRTHRARFGVFFFSEREDAA
jgi:hypothetical protein